MTTHQKYQPNHCSINFSVRCADSVICFFKNFFHKKYDYVIREIENTKKAIELLISTKRYKSKLEKLNIIYSLMTSVIIYNE
jgi:hypothetical protein